MVEKKKKAKKESSFNALNRKNQGIRNTIL